MSLALPSRAAPRLAQPRRALPGRAAPGHASQGTIQPLGQRPALGGRHLCDLIENRMMPNALQRLSRPARPGQRNFGRGTIKRLRCQGRTQRHKAITQRLSLGPQGGAVDPLGKTRPIFA
jgi:hypothetical protein